MSPGSCRCSPFSLAIFHLTTTAETELAVRSNPDDLTDLADCCRPVQSTLALSSSYIVKKQRKYTINVAAFAGP
jgi:hypothetical protein